MRIQKRDMAEGKPYMDRQDPAYLTYIEDQIQSACSRSVKDSQVILAITARLDQLEVVSRRRKGSTNPFDDDFEQDPSTGSRSIAGFTGDRGRPGSGSDLHGSLKGGFLADLVGGPLMSALKQLSQAIDPSPVSHKGMVYRPEYYIQHVDKGMQVKMLDHTKLTYKELVSGMGRVMQYLVENGGDVAGYVGHFNFIAEQAYQHSFVDQAFVGYDRFVVDKYIKLETSNKTPKVFAVGDVLGVASHFHAGNFQSTQKKTSTAYRGSASSIR